MGLPGSATVPTCTRVACPQAAFEQPTSAARCRESARPQQQAAAVPTLTVGGAKAAAHLVGDPGHVVEPEHQAIRRVARRQAVDLHRPAPRRREVGQQPIGRVVLVGVAGRGLVLEDVHVDGAVCGHAVRKWRLSAAPSVSFGETLLRTSTVYSSSWRVGPSGPDRSRRCSPSCWR